MTKQYFIEYESDRMICGSNIHHLCNTSTLKSAKSAIRSAKNKEWVKEVNARNFRVYDSFADIDETTDHVPCVYFEQ